MVVAKGLARKCNSLSFRNVVHQRQAFAPPFPSISVTCQYSRESRSSHSIVVRAKVCFLFLCLFLFLNKNVHILHIM